MEKEITLKELKKIMFPGFEGVLLLDHGKTYSVSVNPGNILEFDGKKMSWDNFHAMLTTFSKVRLIPDNVDNRHYDFEIGVLVSEFGHGGRRVPGPDRKLGRPVSGLAPKKKVCITISPELIELMKLQPTFVNVSSFIDSVLVDYFDDFLSNGES